MPELHEFWDPDEWEDHAHGLLQDRHGAVNVQKVPARHKGDFGLDYYCLMERVVYQCYAVQEPCEVTIRASKQKTKITTDLTKFCTRTELFALFGNAKINRWILLVPIHDSAQVNLHLTMKTAQVKQSGLPYIGDDFEVLIHDIDCFDSDSRQARAARRRLVTIPFNQATQEEVDSWTQTSNPLVAALSMKLRKRLNTSDPQKIEGAVQEAVRSFLEKENALQSLRQSAPELHESLVGVITRHLEKLNFYGPPDDGSPREILRAELESLQAELKAGIPNF